jgi:hypothetical protein
VIRPGACCMRPSSAASSTEPMSCEPSSSTSSRWPTGAHQRSGAACKAGAHPAIHGSFAVLGFREPPDLAPAAASASSSGTLGPVCRPAGDCRVRRLEAPGRHSLPPIPSDI